MMDLTPFYLSIQLALITTIILFIVAVPIAFWLSESRSKWRHVIEALISMPLVLPPTVLGFYLLVAFSPQSGIGKWLNEIFGLELIFSFSGLVAASIVYSLPFMVNPIYSGLLALPRSMKETSYVLGKSKLETLRLVLLPNIVPALITGTVLTFAHTIGEFGVVLMIGGSIPGQTQVASIEVYDLVERMDFAGANQYALILVAVTFTLLLLTYVLGKRNQNGGVL